MYCIQCGVKLADTEVRCPLCATEVFHPHITRKEATTLYPTTKNPPQAIHPWGQLVIVTILVLLASGICLVCDLQVAGRVVWSGFVIGGLVLAYIALILPMWFPRPNPVLFVPLAFIAAGAYLLYINLATGGHWFLSFAFPVTGFVGLLATVVAALIRYTRKGRLYIYGGATILLGAFMLLLEFLMSITFHNCGFCTWSLYPLIALCVIGLTLILIAVCPPLRESLSRKFFL